jgi:hypothetical protein
VRKKIQTDNTQILLLLRHAGDPGHGSLILLGCLADPDMDPRSSSSEVTEIPGMDPGYFFSFLPLHSNPPLESICPFLYILYFPHTISTTHLWNWFVRFFTFFTFLTGWQ